MEHIDKDFNNDRTPLPTEYKKRVIGHELTVSVYNFTILNIGLK